MQVSSSINFTAETVLGYLISDSWSHSRLGRWGIKFVSVLKTFSVKFCVLLLDIERFAWFFKFQLCIIADGTHQTGMDNCQSVESNVFTPKW